MNISYYVIHKRPSDQALEVIAYYTSGPEEALRKWIEEFGNTALEPVFVHSKFVPPTDTTPKSVFRVEKVPMPEYKLFR